MNKNSLLLVINTVPENKAKKLARILLEEKLCACVNIVGSVKSFFWWENKIDKEKEAILLIKTKTSLFNKLKKTIEKNHPYSVCEIIAFKIDRINSKYKNWLINETA